jgi:hypothetical protein
MVNGGPSASVAFGFEGEASASGTRYRFAESVEGLKGVDNVGRVAPGIYRGSARVRLYLVIGFAGIVVDLASITVKVLTRLDRAARMTSVGAAVLLLGTALVGGAVYVKTHRRELDAGLEALRRRFAAWE